MIFSLSATIYPCPETYQERQEMLKGVNLRINELQTVLDQSLKLCNSILENASLNLKNWFCQIRKMKAIYHTMNMFKFDKKSVIAECWIPVNEAPKVKEVLDSETVINLKLNSIIILTLMKNIY
jgi:V-type H+-transporting ATPase subunit a